MMKSNLPQEIRNIWTDMYLFHATFEKMGNTSEEWSQFLETMKDICKKHNNHPLCIKLGVATIEYLNDQRKEAATN